MDMTVDSAVMLEAEVTSPSTLLSLMCFPLSISTPRPPQFLPFPWNPFHVIKDTQMKWPHWRSGFQQGEWKCLKEPSSGRSRMARRGLCHGMDQYHLSY
ncbi:hypothetical protein ABG768_008771 [Culter alburnus]|uniref:Uncharacterized protein n=1 Tax=Culter alburnus TaxID=194366 RepID=A0AAW1ZKG8_CULAL